MHTFYILLLWTGKSENKIIKNNRQIKKINLNTSQRIKLKATSL